ncbi:MAG: Uma2 family endonuclease [Nitratiruptor sp.]|nr:Uma2 family endonuclease [Nitratiruptor sp.]NPA83893.1 Uma2 family endonuclease [Campylobacterota bacterium]
MEVVQLVERYTIEDYELWEGDWELIKGVPYAMAPAPVSKHQWLMGRIVSFLNDALEECDECYVLAEAEWRISKDTVVRPDVMVVCDELRDYISTRPQIVFEILSPSTRMRDEVMKRSLYQSLGVPYYLIVDPESEEVRFLAFNGVEYRESEPIFAICDETIELDIDYIFKRRR